MVGCDPDVYEQVKPALLGIGDKVTYIGAVGAGEVAKLVHNQIALAVQQVVAEAITMGVKAGWDEPRFQLALARKDIGLATALASEVGVPMPLANVAEQNLIECCNRGW